MSKTHYAIIYDGITNSVFDGQVLTPLIAYRTKHHDTRIVLISFERSNAMASLQNLRVTLTTHNIELVIYKRYPLLTTLSLLPAIYTVRQLLRSTYRYTIHARGPLAGYIALQALEPAACIHSLVQARGLLADEYRFTHHQAPYWTYLWHRYKQWLYHQIEKAVYNNTKVGTIEVVSTALEHHLIANYGTPQSQLKLAAHDLPATISAHQRTTWRNEVRKELGISQTTHVYCYNGSAKPWQCPEETIAYFADAYTRNANSFLLILTKDIAPFAAFAAQYTLPSQSYALVTVAHTTIYRYLSACDTGIVLRQPHIVNWVSRPTKAIEYKAAGLTIVHNNTIAYLTDNNEQLQP